MHIIWHMTVLNPDKPKNVKSPRDFHANTISKSILIANLRCEKYTLPFPGPWHIEIPRVISKRVDERL